MGKFVILAILQIECILVVYLHLEFSKGFEVSWAFFTCKSKLVFYKLLPY